MIWGARKLFEVGASRGEICATTAVTLETTQDRVRGDRPGGSDAVGMEVHVLPQQVPELNEVTSVTPPQTKCIVLLLTL